METSGRKLFYLPVIDADYNAEDEPELVDNIEQLNDEQADPEFAHFFTEVNDIKFANLIGSELQGDKHYYHKPVLDIDFEARLIPSKTEGHYHLYLDGIELSWGDYVKVLEVLAEVGILEQGYVNASIERGMTRVRPPVEEEI